MVFDSRLFGTSPFGCGAPMAASLVVKCDALIHLLLRGLLEGGGGFGFHAEAQFVAQVILHAAPSAAALSICIGALPSAARRGSNRKSGQVPDSTASRCCSRPRCIA